MSVTTSVVVDHPVVELQRLQVCQLARTTLARDESGDASKQQHDPAWLNEDSLKKPLCTADNDVDSQSPEQQTFCPCRAVSSGKTDEDVRLVQAEAAQGWNTTTGFPITRGNIDP